MTTTTMMAAKPPLLMLKDDPDPEAPASVFTAAPLPLLPPSYDVPLLEA